MSQENRPKLVFAGEAILDDQTVRYAIKRSSRAKHVRLEVDIRTGLTIVVPASFNVEELPHVLMKKRRWILGKLARNGTAYLSSTERELKSGDSIPYLGRRLKIVERHTPGAPRSIKLEKNRLLINLNARNSHLKLMLERWYRQQAERLIRERVGELCARLGVTYGRLTIRAAKTRWGSCSQKGNLNFNWKLMMVREPVIDYVIIHELSHLREMNHSKKFWELVAKHCPRWSKHRKWLKDHETGLAGDLFFY